MLVIAGSATAGGAKRPKSSRTPKSSASAAPSKRTSSSNTNAEPGASPATPPAAALPASSVAAPEPADFAKKWVPKRVLVLDPNPNGVDEATVRLVGGILTVETAALDDSRLDVINSADVAKMLNLEATKTDLGCSAESCMSEIADAMGTDLVIFGDLGRLGELYLLNLTLFESGAARSRGRISLRTRTIEALPDVLTAQLPVLFAEVLPHLKERAGAARAAPHDDEATRVVQVPSPVAPTDDDSALRPALLYSGAALVALGVAGSVGGLVPTVQYELAWQAADSALRANRRDAYTAAVLERDRALQADERWGQPVLWSGVGSLVLGGALLTTGWLLNGDQTQAGGE